MEHVVQVALAGAVGLLVRADPGDGAAGRGVGRALLAQLRQNLGALRIGTLRTEVEWDDADLMNFFRREGFRPASRMCLDLALDED